MLRRVARTLFLPVVLTAAAMLWWHAPRAPRAVVAMDHSVYVWQRDWTPQVRRAVAERLQDVREVSVLAGEIAWGGDARAMTPIRLPWRELSACGRPVVLALRLGACDAATLSDATARAWVCSQAESIVRAAHEGGLQPAELQLDFDAATSQLAAYRDLVEQVSKTLSPLPVTLTALPTWMSSSDFGPLVRSVPRYVLQVHAFDRATLEHAHPTLCDAVDARRWVERAAGFGVPFEVALPTYGYLVVYGPDHRVKGLVAEAHDERLRGALGVRELSADPAAMAELVRDWRVDRPACMRGVVWYRLPVDGDRLNWSWPTLASVMRGEVPQGELRMEMERPEPGLVEIVASNGGDGDVPLPRGWTARWPDGVTLLGRDGLGAVITAGGGRREASFSWMAAQDRRLRPGERRRMAWMRFDADTEVTLHVEDD